MRSTSADASLPRRLLFAYALLVVYASLHPLTGWRATSAPLLDFITAPWPRYVTTFDLGINVLVYIPLGFLLFSALTNRLPVWLAGALALSAAAALSFSLELLQHFLPSRVPSNADLLCNTLGALIGALLGMRYGHALLTGGRLHALRLSFVAEGRHAEIGLFLLALWLIGQASPDPLLFGLGNLRSLLDLPATLHSAESFFRFETAITATNVLAVGLLTSLLVRRHAMAYALLLILAALIVKAVAMSILFSPDRALLWLTPGAQTGLAMGCVILVASFVLPVALRRTLAALALLLSSALVNLAPENPYLEAALSAWTPGQFMNFNGLSRLITSIWPYLALPYLMLPAKRR